MGFVLHSPVCQTNIKKQLIDDELTRIFNKMIKQIAIHEPFVGKLKMQLFFFSSRSYHYEQGKKKNVVYTQCLLLSERNLRFFFRWIFVQQLAFDDVVC